MIIKLFEQQNREDQFVFDTMDAYRDNLDEEKLQTVLKRIKDKFDLDCEKSNDQIINAFLYQNRYITNLQKNFFQREKLQVLKK